MQANNFDRPGLGTAWSIGCVVRVEVALLFCCCSSGTGWISYSSTYRSNGFQYSSVWSCTWEYWNATISFMQDAVNSFYNTFVIIVLPALLDLCTPCVLPHLCSREGVGIVHASIIVWFRSDCVIDVSSSTDLLELFLIHDCRWVIEWLLHEITNLKSLYR